MQKARLFIFAWLCLLLSSTTAIAQRTEKFLRSVPEAEGVSSQGIINFLEAARKGNLELHSFMFLRHGKIIAEGWWNPYRPDLRHSMYSVSKSFTSTAVGFAVEEKKLSVNDKVISFFPGELPDTLGSFLSELKVKDLLTMSTGHDADPTGALLRSNGNWAKLFLSTPLLYAPGTRFVYNTIATYMLAAIVEKVTGKKLLDYLQPRLFAPLGIYGIDWELSPQGIAAGGYGLRLKSEDMAKFGQLYLQKGTWNGKQIISKNWIEEATSSKIEQRPIWVPADRPKDSSDWLQGYGYQFWRNRYSGFRADGLAGQYIMVLPEQDAVIILTAEVANTQDELNLVWKYLLPAIQEKKLAINKNTYETLKKKLSSLALPLPPGNSDTTASGILPAKIFTLESNEKHIKTISLAQRHDTCVVTITTDTAEYKIAFGHRKWVNGETRKPGPYFMANLVGLLPFKVAGSFSWTDAHSLELALRYIETPHSERISLHFEDGGVVGFVEFSNGKGKRVELRGKM